jgi:hypothetical protein
LAGTWLDSNGHVIYGATKHNEPFLLGFVEANERLDGPQARHVRYGDTGDQLYAQDRTNRAWVALDRPSLNVVATFSSFKAMLTKVAARRRRGMTGHSREQQRRGME